MSNTQMTITELQDAKMVPFDKIYLDPNNPRIAPEDPPGYSNPDALLNSELQDSIALKVREVYEVADLEASILTHGWVPLDSIIVWEHPKQPGRYIVVEGNTRTVALRTLRGERLQHERKKLEKIKKSSFKEEIKTQEETVRRLEAIVSKTNSLRVFPVAASTVEQLQAILPRLLGVRHISHAKEWKPFATNLYILSLYENLFRKHHGNKTGLRLENDLVNAVSNMVSLNSTKTRRNIQAASAFSHFKRDFEHRLPEGESFSNADQYFFEEILQHGYPREQFGFTKDMLRLPSESEEVLFRWAFAKPRNGKGDENDNIFYKAESIRAWQRMAKYDEKAGTSFAKQLDVDDPAQTQSIRKIEAEYNMHKTRCTPIETLDSLRKSLKDLKVDTLLSQQEHLAPILEDVAQMIAYYQKMIKAVAE